MPLIGTRADALRLSVSGIEITHLQALGTIPGVAILAVAARNGVGTGRLRTQGDGRLVSWRAPGSSTFGSAVNLGVDGDYLLEDGEDTDKFLRIRATTSWLSPTPVEGSVYLTDTYNNGIGHDDVTAAEAESGDTETYQISMDNASRAALSDIRFWLDASTDDLEISDNGSTWVSPTTEETALVFPQLLIGASATLHLRRTIAAAKQSDPSVLNKLHARFTGLG